MASQSLYRRYRSQRFSEIVGQQHVVRALRNAVANGTEGHAYLLSGPRGTGKTSTARILAKALNCPDVVDGEPCGVCESCKAIELGASYDLFELDAASNNGVGEMRDLISRAAVGSPGRTKVYVLDEVHMLSPAASNALLKTLEEPPAHVCFVLATTDPQKVLPTIRSRTQHYEFTLLSADELTAHVRWIVADAGLDVDEASIAHVVRVGRGSARDTLSALDQVVAAGGVSERDEPVSGLLDAIAERDQAGALRAVSDATSQGRDPRVLAEALLAALRDAFLGSVGADLSHLSEDDRDRLVGFGTGFGTATITRSLEAVGAALIEMRQAPDPRVPLEVALLRICDPALDTSMAAVLERLERVERAVASGPAAVPPEREAPPSPPTADGAAPQPPDLPSRDELVRAFDEDIMGRLRQGTKAIYANGSVVGVSDGAVVFAFENRPTRDHAEKRRAEVEAAFADRFGRKVPLRLVDEAGAAAFTDPGSSTSPSVSAPARAGGSRRAEQAPDQQTAVDVSEEIVEVGDVADLEDATDVPTSGLAKLTDAFPGAVVMEEDQ